MRIAQVAPLYESVLPKLYGATERIVSYLTEELVRLGHQVTLFASADSRTRAELVPICPRGLWRDASVWETLAHHVLQMERVAQSAHRFDVIHYHGDPLHYPLARRLPCATVTTLHGLLLPVDHGPLLEEFGDAPLVSISDDQRRPLPQVNWQATIHHGLPPDVLSFHERPGDYLAFLGRISPEKRVDLAIEIAREAGMKIRIAAKIDPSDQDYYESVRHLFDEPHVEFLGEIGEENKGEFLGNAAALLFPVDWPEPFGLVMIEALACGTPVIAFRRGSVPEIIEHGLTGFVVDNVEEAARAARRISLIKREICRSEFENRFSARRMCHDYLRVYRGVLAENRRRGVNSGDLSLVA